MRSKSCKLSEKKTDAERVGNLSERRDQLLQRSDSVPKLFFPHLPEKKGSRTYDPKSS
jgi:hypothetical protein